MEIILSKQCKSLTGSLGRGFGYFIVRRWCRKDVKYRYYSVRSKWNVPPDGHLQFILACAELAQMRLHIVDIVVPRDEIAQALTETGRGALGSAIFYGHCGKDIYHATDIINLKNNWLK